MGGEATVAGLDGPVPGGGVSDKLGCGDAVAAARSGAAIGVLGSYVSKRGGAERGSTGSKDSNGVAMATAGRAADEAGIEPSSSSGWGGNGVLGAVS